MQKLSELVRRHLDSEGVSESRVMVLTSLHTNVDLIVAHLNTNGPRVRASGYIRQVEGGDGGQESMNLEERATTIDRFKTGKYNVLVSTVAIGEKDMNSKEIDLIISYDGCPTSVWMLERMCRKRDGKIIVLLSEGREAKRWDEAEKPSRAAIDESAIKLCNDVAKMIPQGVQPKCVEKMMKIEPYDREIHGKLSSKRSHVGSENSTSAKRRDAEAGSRKVPEGY
ncbi:3'-5' DNA helicase [Ceratobasidium sp. 395]|nr:3'-5' DNA helicase [Ceratobasidium sp. 395]